MFTPTTPRRHPRLRAVLDGAGDRMQAAGPRRLLVALGGLQLVVLVSALLRIPGLGLPEAGASVLSVFLLALWAWMATPLDDTWVALGAGVAVVLLGAAEADVLFDALGDPTVWLLLASFVLAAGVTSSGLAMRAARRIVRTARRPRTLAHLCTAGLVTSAFLVPSTSGRAALALPVFVALASALGDRRRVIVALAVLFPSVILLSAFASLIGAGAHLVTVQLIAGATGQTLDFATWLMLGLPVAVVCSHVACELVLLLFTRSDDRRDRFTLALPPTGDGTGRLRPAELRTLLIVGAVVVLWLTAGLHGVPPTLTALVGALVITLPVVGTTTLKAAVAGVPWSLVLFLAATLALGSAIVDSGASDWLARTALAPLAAVPGGGWLFVMTVAVVSAVAHLVVPSRTARSAALVPIIIAVAPAVGVSPLVAAMISTAAAGFCHTLPSSAKPVAIFSDVPGTPTYAPADLLRLSVALAPATVGIVLLAAAWWWPLLGHPISG